VATVAGLTLSFDFPTTPQSFQSGFLCCEGFVTRLNPSGTALVYSTLFGGVDMDRVHAITLDSSGAATFVGQTWSEQGQAFPTTKGAFQEKHTTSPSECFLSRLGPSGDRLFYSTVFGGSDTDGGGGYLMMGVDLDAMNAATVGGTTGSADFPVTPGAFDTAPFGPTGLPKGGFVARFDLLPKGVSKFGASTPGCAGPLAAGVTSMPWVGNPTFGMTCLDAPPNGLGFLGIAAGSLATPVFASGAAVWIDPSALVLLPLLANAKGFVEVVVPLPAGFVVPGMQGFLQFFWPDPCAPGGISASNALEVVVQPP
jgi:hypothetical protein